MGNGMVAWSWNSLFCLCGVPAKDPVEIIIGHQSSYADVVAFRTIPLTWEKAQLAFEQ